MSMRSSKDEDAIFLVDVLLKLWVRRGVIVASLAISTVIATISHLYLGFQSSAPIVYDISLTGITKSRYPGGPKFSPSDLTSSIVLKQLQRDLNLEDFDFFNGAISSGYNSPLTAGIIRKYEQKLAKKRLSPAEIEDINQKFSEELKEVSQTGVRITVRHNMLGLTAEEGKQIAHLIPEIWSRTFSTKFTTVPSSYFSLAVPSSALNLNSTSGLFEIKEYLDNIISSSKAVMENKRVRFVKSDDGLNIVNLVQKAEFFRDGQLLSMINEKIQNNDAEAIFYAEKLRLKILEKQEIIASVDLSIESIEGILGKSEKNGSSNLNSNPSGLGLSGTAVTDIANLVNQTSFLAKQLTFLHERRQALSEDVAALRTEQKLVSRPQEHQTKIAQIRSSMEGIVSINDLYLELSEKINLSQDDINEKFFSQLTQPKLAYSHRPRIATVISAIVLLAGLLTGLVLALVIPSNRVLRQK